MLYLVLIYDLDKYPIPLFRMNISGTCFKSFIKCFFNNEHVVGIKTKLKSGDAPTMKTKHSIFFFLAKVDFNGYTIICWWTIGC